MEYEFKVVAEVAWAVLIGIAIAGATILVNFDPAEIVDWQTWAIGAGGGVARAVGAAVLMVLRPDA